ncbi:MAG: Protein translocase subunit SecY [Candidatus Nomurabacteria bacterium GW2011_GWF2_35_66]|uniref:Protein translocase subunit SecY n=1 Tax=Candidatus Nomurabacteria bacterium GW2011_GWE1_35_16 TaxID=1618761 RepID=A0A0G0EEX6_9BACT|nr:MAG: Protein translocase subunit SecY [Candidatus Nomurabacteria bacterium GW2011_GWF1_34_20]KKP61629.1 MAG: Protein translocase subunit SecY [Candidatus Nomurabacteria bacterium GW2011_GWE2_34_25]KKP65922.1 MAG: Protein translocase subunit SecY [Candidatus Nomurabacteria bacterium GW2011_GWE1_35_16]KKP82978.1 MAG: Protein translocase subunit SecY [Candidatus Nomurabacteria bacterium GW2011_GWF2_35_66]HAE36292.1 preprotein translocase subunit SecY [Candidatus Nomurabacteria bacterium]
METVFNKIKMIFTDKTLRSRVLFVLGALILFRLLSSIPIPGIDAFRLQTFINNNQFLGVLNMFSGGGLSTLSILMLGVGPYITASIIMQLLTIMSPRLKAMYQEDGEIGRKKFAQFSRMITVPLAIVQGFALLFVLKKQGILVDLTLFNMIANLSVIVAGSMLIMWIGELISEFGIGNGMSLIIFAGIVANIPTEISQFMFTFNVANLPLYILFLAVGLLIIAGVVVMTEAERPIPVTYAKQVRGDHVAGGTQTYLPLRVNQAGVIPIIFALSILMFPQLIGNALAGTTGALLSVSKGLLWFVANTWLYSLLYFIFVFLFTYFYTAVTFDPNQLSENLQKNGAFIPGIRPGPATREYIEKILTRITTIGAVFLGAIAVLPLIMKSITGITAFAIGGTALLIVVSVVLDLIKKIEAQLSMREY